MKTLLLIALLILSWHVPVHAQIPVIDLDSVSSALYPDVNDEKPDLPSPFMDQTGETYVIAVTNESQYAIMPVTLRNEGRIGRQLVVDTADFPVLARTGLHDDRTLYKTKSITGRTVEEINELAWPNGLSQSGFLAADEDIISVLRDDNYIVQKLQLTHPQLAAPLFHVLNMMDEDLDLDRWNMTKHRWEHIRSFFYNGRQVFVEAEDTKGGQRSIFNDGIEGGFYIQLRREPTEAETQFLKEKYDRLAAPEFDQLLNKLSAFNTGEMQPQYIMRYGFYEGHTYWRTDPIAIAFIFGLKSLEEIENAFPSMLYDMLHLHFTAL